jgi:hypothetical protein
VGRRRIEEPSNGKSAFTETRGGGVSCGETSGSDRSLVVVALQALYRVRCTAYQAACTACDLAGCPAPQYTMFGIDEVSDALRRIGAAPIPIR